MGARSLEKSVDDVINVCYNRLGSVTCDERND